MGKRRISPEQQARRAQLGHLMKGAGIKSMEDIQELFKDMIATVVNQGLEGELDEDYLGYWMNYIENVNVWFKLPLVLPLPEHTILYDPGA